ncbi:MAG: hypothetical protein WC356_00635 [Candidatus Micrarchaeia archaeon]|jgi:hypothetical protein
MKYLDWQNSFKIFLIALILCSPLAYAEFLDSYTETELVSWQVMTLIAVFVSFSLVIIGYIIAYVLQNQQLEALFKNELTQVIITGIGICLLLFILGIFEIGLMPAINERLNGTETTLQASSQQVIVNKLNRIEERFEGLISYTDKISEQGSKYASCSFWSVGFYIGGCSGLNVILGPLTMGLNAVAIGITDVYSLYLLSRVAVLIYTFLLPLGIFFRTFHITRQFGGFLITVALAFGIVFPASVLFLEVISVDFFENELLIPRNPEHITYIIDEGNVERCDEFSPDFNDHISPNLKNEPGLLNKNTLDILGAEIIVDIILFTLIIIIILLTFIGATVSFFGGTVDLTGLTRLSV